MEDKIEIYHLRRPREKHFLKKDGTMIAQLYTEDIHYLKNGHYEEIEDTLKDYGNKITNKNPNFQTNFKKESGTLLEIERFGHTLSMDLKQKSNVCPKQNHDRIEYQEIIKGIDLHYQVSKNKLKESIVLKEKPTIDTLEFVITTDLELKLEQKKIKAYEQDKTIFVIEAPYMIDQKGKENHKLFYQLEKHENHYDLLLKLDQQWLEEATYPVLIDPTITTSGQNKNVYDTYIYPGDTNVDRNAKDHLKMGVEMIDGNPRVNRTLIKFDLPTIGTGSQIIKAEATLIGYPKYIEYKKTIFDVHRITQDWEETKANWDTMNDKYDPRIEDWNQLSYSGYTDEGNTIDPKLNEFDITNLVKKWYSGTPNYGMMIKAHLEQYNEEYPMVSCFSKNNKVIGGNPQPVLVIYYRNQNGLENYMDYQEQGFTEGTTFANLYNGNLVGSFNIGSTVSSKFPVNLSLIYNTNDVILNNNYGYGLGYKLSLHQLLEIETIENTQLLRYLDSDGTYHYFYKGSDITPVTGEGIDAEVVKRDANTYYDEDGLSLTITKENEEYIMKDSDSNTSYFTKRGNIWYLTKIQDTSKNQIKIEYDSNNRIQKVTDADENLITLTYETNKIIVTSPNEVVTVTYQSNQPVSLITKNGTTFIHYNQHRIIDKISDITSKSIGYEYYDTKPYRVKKMLEYGVNNTLGQHMEFIYGFNSTTVKDSKGGYYTYTFNDNGNTLGVTSLDKSQDIKNAYGKNFEYGEKNPYTTSFGTMNKLLEEKATMQVVKNYLKNSSFENDSLLFTSIGNKNAQIVDQIYHTGNKSLFLNGATIEQTVVVPKGNYYTFSAYLKSDTTSKIELSYLDSTGNKVEKNKSVLKNQTFERSFVTIFYPENATSDLKISISESKNTYIDDIQLEEGEVANLYNYIDNSDFNDGLEGWNINSYSHYPGYDKTPLSEIITLPTGKTALKVNSDPYLSESIEKKFNVSGKAGDVYTIYFWYKNTGIESTSGPTSNKKVLIRFDYGEMDDPHGLIPRGNFTANNTEWQLFEETFMAEYDYSNFTLTIFNEYNVNELYFTNFALYQPIKTTGYRYDKEGNMTEISDPTSGPKELSDDKNNQLIKVMDVKGSNFIYEYDNTITDRILKGISATGISNEIEYDSFGNPIITRVCNKNQKTEIEGNYSVRKKGTKLYFQINNQTNLMELKEDCCSHDVLLFEKVDQYYKISSAVRTGYSFYQNGEYLTLNKNHYSLFELIQNKNGSYNIKLKNNDTSNPLLLTDQNSILKLLKEDNTENQEFYLEEAGQKLFTENKAVYTEDGKFIKTTIDTLGRKTNYDIDPVSGLTKSITDPVGNTCFYTYNDKEQMTKFEKSGKSVMYEYNDQNLLSKIKHENQEYNFTYDEFLNPKEVSIGNQKLITNHYLNNNGNLKSCTYGNQDTLFYTYDEFDRIKTITKMDDVITYHYDNLGNLAKIKTKNDEYYYGYDNSNRLIDYDGKNHKYHYIYDENGNVKEKSLNFGTFNHNVSYEYNLDNSITKVLLEHNANEYDYQGYLNITYDELGRVCSKNLNGQHKMDYHYITNGYKTSFIVDRLTVLDDTFKCQYDALDNITDIYENDILINHYEYDIHSELIKDEDHRRGITTTYLYDNSGNIVQKKEYKLGSEELIKVDQYEYSNSDWKDQLTKFNNITITYDPIGNPLQIGNKLLTWTNGRQLKAIKDNNLDIKFEYNKDSIRTKKIVNGVETTYSLENNHILVEQTGQNVIYYIRDDSNNLIGFLYNNTVYYYVKNLSEDIIGIMDSNYQLIANYSYDAYGKLLKITDQNGIEITDSNHIAYLNPFRYRSYYYDSETGLYYLNSRYYNPEWGRFINLDGTIGANEDITSHNLFVYCSNNPINKIDPSGKIGLILGSMIIGGVAGFLAGGIIGAAESKAKTGKVKKTKVVERGILGGIAGSLIGLGVGLLGSKAVSLLTTTPQTQVIAEEGYETFRQLKQNIPKPAPGNQLHHIVEQSQIVKAGFDPKMIHNPKNIMEISRELHYKISGFYNGVHDDLCAGGRLRECISTWSFQEQWELGMKVIKKMGG